MFVKKQVIINLEAVLAPGVNVEFTGQGRLKGLRAIVVGGIEVNGRWVVELVNPPPGVDKNQVNIWRDTTGHITTRW